jgi:hypothetical protein
VASAIHVLMGPTASRDKMMNIDKLGEPAKAKANASVETHLAEEYVR